MEQVGCPSRHPGEVVLVAARESPPPQKHNLCPLEPSKVLYAGEAPASLPSCAAGPSAVRSPRPCLALQNFPGARKGSTAGRPGVKEEEEKGPHRRRNPAWC